MKTGNSDNLNIQPHPIFLDLLKNSDSVAKTVIEK